MDVEGAIHVSLIGQTGRGDIRIMNGGEVNHGFSASGGFHDLAEILYITDQVLDWTPLGPGYAI
jgi:hypothetical protein